MAPGEPELAEDGAYPALPDNEYGWEKLYSERVALAFGRRYGMPVRIARFQNCYGPEGTWQGGREKAPAAMCRKVAEAPDGGAIEVWGDGKAIRSYTYVDDMVDGIYRLMQSELEGPVNIGAPEYVTVDELAQTVAAVAGKSIRIEHVEGPVGVRSRNFSHAADRVDRLVGALSRSRRASRRPIRGSRSRCGSTAIRGVDRGAGAGRLAPDSVRSDLLPLHLAHERKALFHAVAIPCVLEAAGHRHLGQEIVGGTRGADEVMHSSRRGCSRPGGSPSRGPACRGPKERRRNSCSARGSPRSS